MYAFCLDLYFLGTLFVYLNNKKLIMVIFFVYFKKDLIMSVTSVSQQLIISLSEETENTVKADSIERYMPVGKTGSEYERIDGVLDKFKEAQNFMARIDS